MNLLESSFDWLLATTLRASVLAVAIVSTQWLLRRWLPPQWRYALWLPLLLVLTLPVLPTVSFGILPKKAPALVETAPRIGAAGSPATESVAPSAVTSHPRTTAKVSPWAVVWLAGSAAVFLSGIAGYRRNMRRIMKRGVTADGALLRSIESAAREVGLEKLPRVIVSPEMESPAVTGFIRPALLLPAGFPQGFSEAEARLILLHELTHLKRLDLPVNGLCFIFQALHWFNPILWYAFVRMRADRETACDAQVLSLDPNDRRSDYGNALLKLQSAAPRSGLQLGFVGIFESSAELKNRIREISSRRRSHPAWRAGGVAVIGVLTLFGATKAEEAKPEPTETPAVPRVAEIEPQEEQGTEAIVAKLKTIVIPVVKFEKTSLEEAIDFIRMRAEELDTAEKDPAKKGMSFVVRKPRGPEGTLPDPGKALVTMDLKNATMISVLTEIAKQTQLRFIVDEFAVTFVPANFENNFVTGPQPPEPQLPKGKAAEAARQIILPTVDFADVSLTQAVAFLNHLAKENAKGKPVFPVVLDAKVDGAIRITELRLRNVPLFEAVRYVSGATKTSLTANDTEIRITKP